MKPQDLKKAIEEAANWEQIATEEERTNISWAEAKRRVLDRIFDKWKIKLK